MLTLFVTFNPTARDAIASKNRQKKDSKTLVQGENLYF